MIIMKCPNCRCVIPESSILCNYCGYRLPLGDETTVPVFHGRIGAYTSELLRSYYANAYGQPKYNSVYRPNRVRHERVMQTASSGSKWDFSLINSDGTLNVSKALIYLLGIGVIFCLIMILLLLLLIL